MFFQIHTLTSYPASLLNRDDAGFAKRLVFGGETRFRISSQCQKRHWRVFDGAGSLAEVARSRGQDLSLRSRYTFEMFLRQPLVERGVPDSWAEALTTALMKVVTGESPAAKKKQSKKAETEASGPELLQTSQITVLGRPEMEYLVSVGERLYRELSARGAASPEKATKNLFKSKDEKELRENLKAIKVAAGLDGAIFGRMVTSDMLSRMDAAVHVAHAFTVHRAEPEPDYFTALDDLQAEVAGIELGSGHINSMELTTGIYYGYVAVDVGLLLDNLSQDRQLAGAAMGSLVETIARVSPGAKLGSTAPHSYAGLMLVERGAEQPRTLANAFLDPVPLGEGMWSRAYEQLGQHLSQLDQVYGGTERKYLALEPVASLGEALRPEDRVNLRQLAGWVKESIEGAA